MAFQPSQMSEETLRRLVDNLVRYNKSNPLQNPKRSQLQEAVAATLGWPNYHMASTTLKNSHERKSKTDTLGWTLPSKLGRPSYNSDLSNTLPEEWTETGTYNVDNDTLHLETGKIPGSIFLQEDEDKRRKTFEDILKYNPTKPICLIQGPMSLIKDMPNSENMKTLTLQQFLVSSNEDTIKNMLLASFDNLNDRDNVFFQNRARSLLAAVIPIFVYKRDNAIGKNHTNSDTLIKMLSLKSILDIIHDANVPKEKSKNIQSYVETIAGYSEVKGQDQSFTTQEQHGFCEMMIASYKDKIEQDGTLFLAPLENPKKNRAQIKIPEKTLTKSEEEMIKLSISQWANEHKDGLIFIDILPKKSPLWAWVLNRQGHWTDDGLGVWVGVTDESDIDEHVQHQLQNRLKIHLGWPIQR